MQMEGEVALKNLFKRIRLLAVIAITCAAAIGYVQLTRYEGAFDFILFLICSFFAFNFFAMRMFCQFSYFFKRLGICVQTALVEVGYLSFVSHYFKSFMQWGLSILLFFILIYLEDLLSFARVIREYVSCFYKKSER